MLVRRDSMKNEYQSHKTTPPSNKHGDEEHDKLFLEAVVRIVPVSAAATQASPTNLSITMLGKASSSVTTHRHGCGICYFRDTIQYIDDRYPTHFRWVYDVLPLEIGLSVWRMILWQLFSITIEAVRARADRNPRIIIRIRLPLV
jgi:hypothetical protein